VNANGTGKSTLMKMLTQLESMGKPKRPAKGRKLWSIEGKAACIVGL
jgi:ABC-type cobalamin/Fe3+-siderophores transport system ATPase subunit